MKELVSIKIIVLDVDYAKVLFPVNVMRIFGKVVGTEDEGKDVVLHVLGMEPYFFCDDAGLNIFDLKKTVETVLRGYANRVDIVMRYKPIGYQVKKSNMLRIVLFNPKTTPDAKRMLIEEIPEVTNRNIYEADIQFKNRYMTDAGISGFDVIEFPEKGKEIPNYGIECNNIYQCKMNEIKILKDELVNIEY